MSVNTTFLTPELYRYLQSVSFHETEVQRSLREYNLTLSSNMCISPEQGQFMGLLIRLMQAKKILEIGTYTGYSSLAMALNLPENGKIICIDPAQEFTDIAQQYWKKADIAHKITLYSEKAKPVLKWLIQDHQQNTFDLVFIDADKQGYDSYYEYALQLVRPQGLIAIDNTLWKGQVLEKTDDSATLAIQQLNQKIHQDQRVMMNLIPIGDGLTLAMKK